MSTPLLHFAIGPVQGFIGQSRRTRDLWASSYLLSLLSAHAIDAAIREGIGELVFPSVNTALITAVLRKGQDRTVFGSEAIRFGSLPNRFAARLERPEHAAGEAVEAVAVAWRKIAESVWIEFLSGEVAGLGDDTQRIWKRQVDGFWRIEWAVGDAFDVLDRRKAWHVHAAPTEHGDKCTVMGCYGHRCTGRRRTSARRVRFADSSPRRQGGRSRAAPDDGESLRHRAGPRTSGGERVHVASHTRADAEWLKLLVEWVRTG